MILREEQKVEKGWTSMAAGTLKIWSERIETRKGKTRSRDDEEDDEDGTRAEWVFWRTVLSSQYPPRLPLKPLPLPPRPRPPPSPRCPRSSNRLSCSSRCLSSRSTNLSLSASCSSSDSGLFTSGFLRSSFSFHAGWPPSLQSLPLGQKPAR